MPQLSDQSPISPQPPQLSQDRALPQNQNPRRKFLKTLTGNPNKWIYLSSLFLVMAVTVFIVYDFSRRNMETQAQAESQPAQQQAQPLVLGEESSIRGQPSASAIAPAIFKQVKEPDFSQITAKSFLVYDMSTGQELASKNPQAKLPIASLTKLITGLVAYDNLDFNASLTVTPEDIFNVSPILHLAVGDQIKINDIFDAMIIGSANDAALTLANHVEKATGRNFDDLMNEKAASLGMADSKFSNPLGFDSKDNYSTAKDLKLAVDASQQLAVFSNLGRRTDFSFSSASGLNYHINATDRLLASHPEIQAIKTGYTDAAMGSIIVKVDFQGRKIVFIVLDSVSREKDLERLEQQVLNSFSLKSS